MGGVSYIELLIILKLAAKEKLRVGKTVPEGISPSGGTAKTDPAATQLGTHGQNDVTAALSRSQTSSFLKEIKMPSQGK